MARFSIRYEPPDLPARFTLQRFREVMVQAIPDAFESARAAVQAAAPRGKTLRLARRITVRVGKRGGSSLRVQIVSQAGYASLVEDGHRLVVGGRLPKRVTFGAALATKLQGRSLGRVVGMVPPHPFAAPAFRSQEQAVTQTLERRLVASMGG